MRHIMMLLALVLIAGCASEMADEPAVADSPEVDDMDMDGMAPDGDMPPMEQDLEGEPDATFTLTGAPFYFEMDGERNPTLRVNEGDLVRIEFSSANGFHDWVVDEFDARTSQVFPENGVTVVEFVAGAPGEYEYYCSVGQHRANGMEGLLIVE